MAKASGAEGRKYRTKTKAAVKEALLGLLARKSLTAITVSELARAAGISRSTFYAHYGNPGEVYDEIMADFGEQMSPMMEQVACSDAFRPTRRPFCALVRDGGDFAALVEDDRFLPAFLAQGNMLQEHDLHEVLARAGYTDAQARALCAFQLSGCFSAAHLINASEEEWSEIRAVIDRFILGGVAACLAAKRSGDER